MLHTKICILVIAAFLASSCYKFKMDDPNAGGGGGVNGAAVPAESALATVASAASDTESNNFTLDGESLDVTDESDFLRPACKAQSAKSECNPNNQISVTWGECASSSGHVLKGGYTNTYSNTDACKRGKVGPLGSGDSVTRTSSGLVIDGVYGGQVIWSTELHKAYNGLTIQGSGLTISKYGDSRAITIGGLHRVLRVGEQVRFEHSIVSLTDVMISGDRSVGTRMINGGSIRVFSNTEKTQTDVSFDQVAWGRADCCYPTSGVVTSVTSNDKSSATSSLVFNRPVCGQATLQTGATSSVVTLQQCE